MLASTRLAAIMFTDIVGYTAMMQENREAAMTAVKGFERVLTDRIASHSGELLQTYGDGSLSVFDSASAAVACAKELIADVEQKEVKNSILLFDALILAKQYDQALELGEYLVENGRNPYWRIARMGWIHAQAGRM